MPTHEGGASAAHGDEDSRTSLETLFLRIQERTATVGVMGLGYVGLPLALACAEVFQRAIGFDVNLERIVKVNEESAAQKRFCGAANFALLRDCDIIVICVPTPLEKSKNPDLSYIRDAADRIAANLRPVSSSSSNPPAIPEPPTSCCCRTSRPAEWCWIAISISPFHPTRRSRQCLSTAKNSKSHRRLHDRFGARCLRILCGTRRRRAYRLERTRTPETVKLLENTFRLVNIGLINEFAVLCNHLGIDSNEVITAAATKPFGFLPFFPGPGAGGHCISARPALPQLESQASKALSLASSSWPTTSIPRCPTMSWISSRRRLTTIRSPCATRAFSWSVSPTKITSRTHVKARRSRSSIGCGTGVLSLVTTIRSFQFSISTSTAGPSGVHRLKLALERPTLRVVSQSLPPRTSPFRHAAQRRARRGDAGARRLRARSLQTRRGGLRCDRTARARVVVDTRDALSTDIRANARARIVHL